ncbi:MAG: alpha/beta hydrolase [Pseudomonadales bacterium]
MLRFVLGVLVAGLIAAGFWLFEGDLPAAEVDARYSNGASAFLTTASGARIHYRDQGNRTGPPLVLVHGSNASLHTWEPWVAALGDRYRVVTLDLPGHGLTGRVPDDDYGSEAMVAAVHAVAEHLNLPGFVLGGNSMGGGVAWRYALAHPDRVRALVLVDASAPWSWRREAPVAGDGDTPLGFTLLRSEAFRAIARNLDPGYLVAQGLRAAYHDPGQVDDALIARYRDLTLRAGSREAILSRFGRAPDTTSDAVDLSVLTMPTLILWGRHDTLIGVEVGERFDAELPDSRLVIYEDLGHVPMEEAPTRTAADVRAFLDRAVESAP